MVNKKKTYRIYKELGMHVRTKKRKKLVRPRIPMMLPTMTNERWSMDFVSDQLSNGRRIRVLNIVDDFSRICVGQIVDFFLISGKRLVRYLDQFKSERGLPMTLVLDNGSEFTGNALFFCSKANGVKVHFIQPGKPTQNAFVESFNGKFRDGCLNQHWFRDIQEARSIINNWRQHFKVVRPHSSMNYQPPALFEEQVAL